MKVFYLCIMVDRSIQESADVKDMHIIKTFVYYIV